MLPKVASLKRYISHRSDIRESLTAIPDSDSKLSVRPTVETHVTEIEASSISQDSYEIDESKGGEMVQWSPTMQSLLDEPPSNLPTRLILGGITFCLFFGLWAWFGEVDQIGKAQGKLVPKGEAYKIESLESAKISQIAVKEGEDVRVGQLIARLNSDEQVREVKRLQNLLATYRQELNQKSYLLEKVKLETTTHKRIAQAEVRGQQSAINSAIAKSEINQNLLKQRQAEFAAHSNRKKRVQNLSTLDREKLAHIEAELAEHKIRLERLKPLVEQGAISEEVYFQAEQSYRQSQQQLTDSKLQGISNISEQIFQSAKALREMEVSITQTQGEIVAGQKEIEQLEAELARQIAERGRIELEAQQKEAQIRLEISQTEAKIVETQSQLANAESLLEKRSLRSPIAGTVLSFNVKNTGKVVQSGETVAEIAPQASPLVLSAVLPDREAGFVQKGMPAQIKLDAYSYQDYGVIPGKVISVSADAKTDEQLGSVYQVKLGTSGINILVHDFSRR